MPDMTITTKFNVEDKVWFYAPEHGKFVEGTITDIQSWDKWNDFRYVIDHELADESKIAFTIDEKNIYSTKNEILSTAFVEDGQDL